jgi:hypothetical protein
MCKLTLGWTLVLHVHAIGEHFLVAGVKPLDGIKCGPDAHALIVVHNGLLIKVPFGIVKNEHSTAINGFFMRRGFEQSIIWTDN